MARVDYQTAPDVQARTEGPDDLEHIEASPASFGAAAAQGVESLGAGALDASKFYGTVAAENGTNNTLQQVTNILHGDPNKQVMGPDGQMQPDTGYFGKRGRDAMDARADVAAEIQNIINDNRQGLATPEAQVEYDNQTRRYQAQWLNEIGTHADQQQSAWATDTNNTSAMLALNAAGRTPNDPAVVAQQQELVNKAYVRNAQLKGESPEGALLKAKQDMTIVRLKSLMISDPAAAKGLLDSDGSVLASRGDYDQIARAVRAANFNAILAPATGEAIGNAKARASAMVGQVGVAPDLKTAFLAQESGNNSNIPASIDGAIGPGQVKPETFAQFARPGEMIDNPADNRAVSARIIDHYAQQYNGDAARVAVAYFSGPGNVAPAGSPTPYIHDYKDGNGKSTSSYVSDILARTQPKSFPSTADALRGTEDQTLNEAQETAAQLFPNEPDYQERYIQGVRRGLDQTITQQDQQTVIDTHIVQQAVASDHPPISEQQLMGMSPQVAQAWRSMQTNNPQAALGIERVFDANAKGKAANLGTQFDMMLQRVLAPPGDPGRISNPSQLWPYVGGGDGGPLTNTGLSRLSDLLTFRSGPGGESGAAQLRTFFQQAHAMLSGQHPELGYYDPNGEERYQRFMMQALPTIQAEAAGGKPLAQVLAPKGDVYNSIFTFKRANGKELTDRILDTNRVNLGALTGDKAVLDPTRAAMVDQAITAHQFTPQQGDMLKGLMLDAQTRKITPQQAKDRAIQLGIFPPDVPRPQ